MNNQISVRLALPADRQAMLEITGDIWEGTDYVPFVWDRWLADEHSYLQVAVVQDRVVGLQHVEVQPEGVCWLEGIRVASDVRRMGVARALQESGLEVARQRGCWAARLSTSTRNEASQRLAEKVGFQAVAAFYPLVAQAGVEAENVPHLRLLLPSDAGQLSTHFGLGESPRSWPLYTQGWTAYSLSPSRLALLLSRGALVMAGDEVRDGLALATCSDPFTSMEVGLLEGPEEAVKKLCLWLRAQAKRSGFDQVRAKIRAEQPVLEAAQEAGFMPPHEFNLTIYELRL